MGAPDQAQAQARLSAWLEEYVKTFAFSGTLGVMQDGVLLFCKAYGLASMEHQVPNTPDTRYRIWSIGKQFTAALVLRLAEQGLLQLEDRLADHFPEWTALDGRITIHHLLNHTSGLFNYANLPDAHRMFYRQHHRRDELVALFTGWPLEFEPGARFQYCNTGYWMLGQLIERVSGQTFAACLEQQIIRPLGLSGTGLDDGRRLVPGLATGYEVDGDGLVSCGYVDMSLVAATGGLYSTAGDLLRWRQALASGAVLRPDTLERMQTPGHGQYGYGVAIDSSGGRRRIHHGGGCEGYLSELHHFVDEGLAIVALSNYGFTAVDKLCRRLDALVRAEPVDLPQRPAFHALPDARLAPLLGTYGDDCLHIELRQAPGTLEIVINGLARLPVYPVSDTAFHHAWIDESYETGQAPDGRPTLWGLPKTERVV